MDDIVYEAVSLGHLCQTKFQIARKLNAQGHPGRSEMWLRLDMAPPNRGARLFGWDVFDWVGGPIDAVSECIECGFAGTFEREDLFLVNGEVYHRTLGINHVHAFEGPGAAASNESLLNSRYASERALYERRAQAFMARLSTPGPVLYVHQTRQFPTAAQVQRLLAALSSKSQAHKFHLLLFAPQETDRDLSAFAGRVTKAYAGDPSSKPKGRDWEGDDASWEAALAPFKIAPPPGPARKMTVDAPPAPAPPKTRFSRLFGR